MYIIIIFNICIAILKWRYIPIRIYVGWKWFKFTTQIYSTKIFWENLYMWNLPIIYFFKFRYHLYAINSINTQSISCILELYVTIINCMVINPSFNRVNFSSIFYLFTRSSFSILFSFYFFLFFCCCNIFLLAYEILTTSCYTSYI